MGVSRLLGHGIAESMAVDLAQNYCVVDDTAPQIPKGRGLPGFKLRRITDFMSGHLDEGFDLSRLVPKPP